MTPSLFIGLSVLNVTIGAPFDAANEQRNLGGTPSTNTAQGIMAGIGTNAPVPAGPAEIFVRLAPVINAKDRPLKERLEALQELNASKDSLSADDQVSLVRATAAISADKSEHPNIRANAVWALSATAMTLRHNRTLTDDEILQECKFLINAAGDEREDIQVRRLSIAAIGDVKIKDGFSVINAILQDKRNVNQSDLARPAAIALGSIAPDKALGPIGGLLETTSNAAVFGSAAYAIGALKSADALPILVKNRMRLGDNLSVDNAIEASTTVVLEILKNTSSPHLRAAVAATRSLWKTEHKQQYTPLLLEIIKNKSASDGIRREVLERLLEDADQLPLDARKERLTGMLPLIEGEGSFNDIAGRMRAVLGAVALPVSGPDMNAGDKSSKAPEIR